jgi:hypothetical protein
VPEPQDEQSAQAWHIHIQPGREVSLLVPAH